MPDPDEIALVAVPGPVDSNRCDGNRWAAPCPWRGAVHTGRITGVADVEITGEVIEWRGPAPFHFLRIAGEAAEIVDDLGKPVSYGWGMVPVAVELGATRWTTSLWPKDGGYLLPIKDAVRRRAGVELGDTVTARLVISIPGVDRSL